MLRAGKRVFSPLVRIRSFCSPTFATEEGTTNYYESKWFTQVDPIEVIGRTPEEEEMFSFKAKKQRSRQEALGQEEEYQIVPKYHKKSGLMIPPVSLSCLRLSVNNGEHFEVIPHAIRSGINLLETTTLYPDSQYIVGEALKELPSSITRDQVILLSKAGFQVEHQGHELRITGHNLSVPFLKQELSASLERMGVACLDFFLLQYPEESGQTATIYKKLKEAFEWLEMEVYAGRIRHYGISSRALTYPQSHKQYISLDKILGLAKEAGGEGHHFSLIQLPFNLHETDFLTAKNHGDGTLSVSEVAKKNDIATITYRPLRTIFDFRFVEYLDHSDKDMEQLLREAFELVIDMERAYKETVQDNPALPSHNHVRIGDSLLSNQDKTPNVALWKDTLLFSLHPYRAKLLKDLIEKKPDAGEWAGKYIIATDRLIDRITWNLESKCRHEADSLIQELKDSFPELGNVPLETKAMRAALSSGAESVSVGMREISFVHEHLNILHYPPLQRETLDRIMEKVKQKKE